MKIASVRFVACLAIPAMVLFTNPDKAHSSISSFVLQSDVQAYFGSRGNAYEASDPVVLPWAGPLIGTYANAPLSGVPTPPAAPVWTGSIPGNPFASGYSTSFNDAFSSPTVGSFTIVAHNNPSPTLVSNDHINLPALTLDQSAGAPSYAYEQLDFEADYGVVGGILAGSTPSYPLHVFGVVGASSTDYAQFNAQINYTWIPSTNTTFSPSGPAVSLGSLTYSALKVGGGTYNGYITPTGSLAAAPTNWGVLEITGYMWVAGDPSSITVSGVPEPSGLTLLGVGAASLCRRWRRSNHSAK